MYMKRLFIISAIILILFCTAINAESNLLKIHFIDAGAGDCILIESPDNKVMMIDTGVAEVSDKVENYLRNNNIQEINILLGTHRHNDHIGGMISIVKDFTVDEIYLSEEIPPESKFFRKVLQDTKNKNLTINRVQPGEYIKLSPLLTVFVMAPNGTDYKSYNNYSVVTRMVYGSTSFLFAGDAEKESEQEILAKGYDLKSNLLKAGHHGYDTSTTQEFLNAISPEYVVISCDNEGPERAVEERLKAAGAELYRTDKHGTVVVISDGKEITITTEK